MKNHKCFCQELSDTKGNSDSIGKNLNGKMSQITIKIPFSSMI